MTLSFTCDYTLQDKDFSSATAYLYYLTVNIIRVIRNWKGPHYIMTQLLIYSYRKLCSWGTVLLGADPKTIVELLQLLYAFGKY